MDKPEIYAKLQVMWGDAFPKTCAMCGYVYPDAQSFIEKTMILREGETGLRYTRDEEIGDIVSLFRNCSCGSTLMEEFQTRRDNTVAGQITRDQFNAILQHLVTLGFDRETTHAELKIMAQDKNSKILAEWHGLIETILAAEK